MPNPNWDRERIGCEAHLLVAMNHPRVVLVLSLSVAAISTAAILVRLVPDMHALGIALWRTAIAGVLLSPTLLRRGTARPRGRQLVLTIAAGFCLALHFWTWFASLQLTSVMRSTVLVCLTPLWAGILSWAVFKAPPSRRFWGGIAVALVGVTIMALGGDTTTATGSWTGDLLALLGGVLSGTYLTIGRAVRPHVDWGPYGAILCLNCALWLLLFAVLSGASLALVGQNALWVILAMALGPQLLGHIGFAWAVRYVPATIVGAVILLEPVGATALGTVVLDEWPSARETLGALVIVIGVFLATIPRNKKAAVA